MPKYLYKCEDGHYHEEERSIYSEQMQVKCDVCRKDLRRVFQAPVFNLVGKGFYRNGG